jgi:hypothetical protein
MSSSKKKAFIACVVLRSELLKLQVLVSGRSQGVYYQ